ncbi:NhaP-type Na+/H+ or K+/H+ antiporter (NhaP) [Fructobacillus cardui]|uniref:hypothetical protein n=1 Tax=Fructobacillus cardui TaxID=2893170 RepID=UPI002D9207FD|nr:NhaP-type Na+/H+ or K+/H+ antiporter (NhaP) [Fructobacillus cardui]
MSILLIIALLVGAVVAANIVQPFVKRIPEALILTVIGARFSIPTNLSRLSNQLRVLFILDYCAHHVSRGTKPPLQYYS